MPMNQSESNANIDLQLALKNVLAIRKMIRSIYCIYCLLNDALIIIINICCN